MFERSKAYSVFATDDIDKAREFSNGTLNLEVSQPFPGGLMLNLPGGRDTLIYHKPDFTPARFTDPAGNILCVHEPVPTG